ncbi:sarcosine oxidase subunit gamma [Palleronia marisminoris]|uniref:Sarcosine oxidase, gamma subunit family n=1 Tax=Palleronia marisminoris TaxID=315423 RepID=A0A1Y5TC72_9RHOB|nr:sarcosine oxidase subunit gamma family protein [Palleronia marisminoris]SFH33102.1 sarcosine oxidase subunit gamma [Palleronia marisminoris]SLN60717.1 Sarcosine oxidase, gamma subunit family [Palleronia marisminoris]
MSDLQSALQGARFDGYVSVFEAQPAGMIQLRADLAEDAVAHAVHRATGATIPQPLGLSTGDRGEALWMAPDELLLRVLTDAIPELLADVQDDLRDHHHLALDVSAMRTEIRVEGAAVREVLAKVTPVDMETLKPGTVRRTRLAQVAAAIWLSNDETAHVLCFRSVATYVFDVLSVSARKGGEVGAF